jgi:hypothetical protein
MVPKVSKCQQTVCLPADSTKCTGFPTDKKTFPWGIIQPVSIETLPFDGLLPPITRGQAGRPKKVRLRNRSELQSEDSPIVFSDCGERGHNKRTCQRRQGGERIERH